MKKKNEKKKRKRKIQLLCKVGIAPINTFQQLFRRKTLVLILDYYFVISIVLENCNLLRPLKTEVSDNLKICQGCRVYRQESTINSSTRIYLSKPKVTRRLYILQKIRQD